MCIRDRLTPTGRKPQPQNNKERGPWGALIIELCCSFLRPDEIDVYKRQPFRGARLDKKTKQDDKQERNAFTVEEVKRLVEILPGEWPDMIRVCLCLLYTSRCV